MKARTGSRVRTLHAISYSYFVAALLLPGGRSRPELMRLSGLSQQLVSRLVKQLRARGARKDDSSYNDVLHIAGWQLDARGRATIAEFRLGPGQDMPQPKKPRAEVVRDYQQRRKARKAKGRKT